MTIETFEKAKSILVKKHDALNQLKILINSSSLNTDLAPIELNVYVRHRGQLQQAEPIYLSGSEAIILMEHLKSYLNNKYEILTSEFENL